MLEEKEQELELFIEEWQETPEKNKKMFLTFKDELQQKDRVILDFVPRVGVTYSLRAKHAAQKNKNLFVMVDVIEDKPRWLSICFYGEMITDPEMRGDAVPGGLLGEDAICFDLAEWDEDFFEYVKKRIEEAHKCAGQ